LQLDKNPFLWQSRQRNCVFFFVVFWPLGGGIKHNLRLKAVEGAGNLKLLCRFRGMNLGGLPNSSGFG